MEDSALQRRVEELEARVRAIEEGLLGAVEPLMLLGFSVSEAQMVALLVKRETVTADALYYLTYGDAGDAVRKVIDVRMSHIRRKLRPYGVTIETHVGAGYSMPGASKMRLGVCVARAVAELRGDYDGQCDLADLRHFDDGSVAVAAHGRISYSYRRVAAGSTEAARRAGK